MILTAYSTALYSSWLFVEGLRLLFDAGDGVSAHLLGKSRKAQRVALTHADRDHITGLLQLQQLNARPHNRLEVLYPADSRGIGLLAEFCRQLDPWSGPYVDWTPVRPEQDVLLENDLRLRVMRNTHVPSPPGVVKSVSYFLVRHVRKLSPEFRGLAGEEIARLRSERGEEALTFVEERGVLAYAGDTGVTEPDPWRGCTTLVHEATFLRVEDMESGKERDQQHSALPDVLRMVRDASPETLILNHFSSRYSEEEIFEAVRTEARALRLPFPVYVVPPGKFVHDILAAQPVWSG
jgi:ribonuclease Z